MPEDALGYTSVFDGEADVETWRSENRRNILIVDDINDSGHTLKWIQQDWEASVAGVAGRETWDQIWGNNVRVAVCINNDASDFKDVDYSALTINKLEDPVWCVFPWEEWWS
jgi:hypoxanthine phosphoribosyltransferase